MGATPPPSDRLQIDRLIERYRLAFSTLDAPAAQAVWPGVDTAALDRAFGQLESQMVEFGECTMSVAAARASATCPGHSTYVTRVGSRSTRVDSRQWTFELRKGAAGWTITNVASR